MKGKRKMHTIPTEYASDARTVSAYNKGYEDGYYGRNEVTETNFASLAEGQAFAIGKETGRKKRKDFDENGF